jgi:hypothetical protein
MPVCFSTAHEPSFEPNKSRKHKPSRKESTKSKVFLFFGHNQWLLQKSKIKSQQKPATRCLPISLAVRRANSKQDDPSIAPKCTQSLSARSLHFVRDEAWTTAGQTKTSTTKETNLVMKGNSNAFFFRRIQQQRKRLVLKAGKNGCLLICSLRSIPRNNR